MVATDKVFAGSIPEIYDRFLVPLIFQSYALDLAGRIAGTAPRHVLETAAGTGVLTRAMASGFLRKCASSQPISTNQCSIARRRSSPLIVACHGNRRMRWRCRSRIERLTSSRASSVRCSFPTRSRVTRRRTASSSRMAISFSMCGTEFRKRVRRCRYRSDGHAFSARPPRFLARTPHGYCDTDKIREQLTAAGFAKISIETVDHRSRAPSPRHPAIAYCQGTPLRNEIEARDASRLEEATNKAADALARRFGNGPVDGRIQAVVISADAMATTISQPQ